MRYLVLSIGVFAAISVSGCKTVSSDSLFANIPADKIAPVSDGSAGTAADVQTSASGLANANVMTPAMSLADSHIRTMNVSSVCRQFNMNSLAYVANPSKSLPGLGIIKTIASGVVAGAASGAVSAIGIESSFVENMVAGTVNQVAYNASRPVIDSVLPGSDNTDKAAELASAAERVGCADPTSWLKGMSLTEAQSLLSILRLDASDVVVDASKAIGVVTE